MRKFNFLLLLVIISIVILPGSVDARTISEAEAILENLSIDNGDGTCTWDVKTMDPSVLIGNSCNYTKSDVYREQPWSKDLSEAEFESFMNDYVNSCKLASVFSVFEIASRKKGNDNWVIGIDFESYEKFDPNNVTLNSWYDEGSDQGMLSKTCKLEYVETNEKLAQEASNVVKKFEPSNYIYSLNTFNSVYHYGPIFQNNKIDSEMILYKFPGFKQQLMDNPEFEYEIAWEGGGGTPTETGCAGYVLAYKDDVAYAMRMVGFTMDNRLYVDKDLEGTPLEKATARLNEFFNNTVDIEFNTNIYEDMVIDGTLSGVYTEVKLGNYVSPIFIVEVDKNVLDKFEVKAHHKKYDIDVITNSYDVPLDATLNVKDVGDTGALDMNKYKILSAYDIDVIKTGNGSYVKNVENGIDVYIPVEGHQAGEKLKVFHITEDNEKGEEFEGEVVEKNGKYYVKFRTTHFSTYAIAEEVNSVLNPDTSDGIISTIIMIIISTLGLVGVYKFKPKRFY